MKNIRFIVSIAPAIFMALLFISGCIGPPKSVYRIEDTQVGPAVKKLAVEKKEYFNHPFILMIIVDSSPCGKALAETIWWADWQKHMLERNVGFVLATSRADSADVVIAAELDNVKAPVLVLPLCDINVAELDVPPGGVPLKILIDSKASIHYVKAYIPDTTASNKMISKIDSIIDMKITDSEN